MKYFASPRQKQLFVKEWKNTAFFASFGFILSIFFRLIQEGASLKLLWSAFFGAFLLNIVVFLVMYTLVRCVCKDKPQS